MSEWKKYRLDEIASHLGDGLHGTPIYDEKGEYYFINGSNLVDGKIVINSNTRRVNETEYYKYKKDLSDKSILLGINGTIGNVGLFNGEKCVLGKSSCYINVGEGFDKQFIKYVLLNDDFQNYIRTNATGTTIKNVGLKLLREYEAFVPSSIDEQKRIASILLSIDDKIGLNIQLNQTLEEMAQNIFEEWCCSTSDYIPDGWSFRTLSEIAEVTSSKRIFMEEYIEAGVPFYRGKEITQLSKGEKVSTELFISDERYNDIKGKFGVPIIGDILITSVGTIGSVWLVDNDSPFYFKDGNITWVKDYKTNITGEYIYQWLKTKGAQEQISSVTIGSTQQALTISALKGLTILIPDKDTVSRTITQLKAINLKRLGNLNQNTVLTQLRNGLLPKLMTGKIEINA